MAKLFNLARMKTATTGTGTITLGSAVSGFLTFALAGAADGDVVTYAIEDGSNREIGYGTYTASGTTLTRTVVNSTNADASISLSGSAQVFITGMASDLKPAYGTSLPVAPFDTQEAILVDSVTLPTYQWRFYYNAGSSNTDKWEFVGGPPAITEVATAQATASATFVALTTAGPSFTLPRAGVYTVGVGCEIAAGSGSRALMSYDIGTTGAAEADALEQVSTGPASSPAGYRMRTKTGFTAVALVSKYRSASSVSTTFSNRFMSVTPVRVS